MARLRKHFTAPVLILIVLAIPALAEVISIAAQQAGWTPHDLAYYLDPNLINFVRPGLAIKITSATVQDARISVRFTLTDPRGLPLDREGVTTPGAVSTSFVAAYIPQGQTTYTPITTRLQVSPITNKSATQGTADSGGTYTRNAEGDYTYVFRTTVPSGFDMSATLSVGMYATRDLSEFGLGSQSENAVFSLVPSGGPVKTVRDVVSTKTCNNCHNPLSAHGGRRKSVELCILCHVPAGVDPDTGNSIDMTEMVHKIHMGEHLPSVQAGKPYQIIGYQQSVLDFSTVAFPDDIKRCEACHKGATQSSIYLTKPSRRACGSCHDNVNFATGEEHVDLPQVSDNLCSTCHIPEGELEFDASIKGAHVNGSFSQQLPGTTLKILKVENGSRGQKPTVTFTVKDKQGNVLEAATMDLLNLILAGPTSDYSAYRSESARGASRVGDTYVYTLTNAIPEDAAGSYAIGIEGYKNTKLNPGTRKEITVRDVGNNDIFYFSVVGGTASPRRKVVSQDKCNTCHGTLMLHGTIRRTIEHCLLCHNPITTDVARRTRPELLPPESVNFKTMIHKIHTGEELKTDFTVYGYGGNPFNFNEVLFPGDRRDCEKCHLAGTYRIPLAEGLLNQVAPRDWINPLQPITGACLSCHTEKSTAAHAAVMTSPALGESCAACHGTNRDFSVDRAHAR